MSTAGHVGLILALTIRGLAVGSYEAMRRVARDAEDLGFDSVWLCDHFLTLAPDTYARNVGIDRSRQTPAAGAGHPGTSMPLLECWTALSALSRDTRRLRLGTSVLCNSYRQPSVLAKMAATLDVISGGRLELGLGAGWFEHEYTAYGIPFPKTSVRIAQLDEGLEVIRRMWTEPAATFHGSHYSIEGAFCDPPPLQKPRPPLWVGGEGDKVHRVAARAADGVNVRWWSPERVLDRTAFLHAACREFGRDPATLERSVTLLLAPQRDAGAAQAVRQRFAAIPASGLIVGPVDECIDRLRAYVKVGVRHFLLTIPEVETGESLEMAGRHVLPALRHEIATSSKDGEGRNRWPTRS